MLDSLWRSSTSFHGGQLSPMLAADWRFEDDPATGQTVEIYPGDAVKRSAVSWSGMMAEIVQATRHVRMAFRFRGSRHLLTLCDQGSAQRRLIFVPAGHDYREWHQPSAPLRVMNFYFDPARMPCQPEAGFALSRLVPRLSFEDASLADTALKLARLVECASCESAPYFEALGLVLVHELVMRLNAGERAAEVPARGGLAAWQRRAVTKHMHEHLAESVALATLARLAGLSPHYFCRAFKQSFGQPPQRYHNDLRMERAKALLAAPKTSVTDVGFTMGYRETSSFTTAFHRTTGLTPTAYRRSLI